MPGRALLDSDPGVVVAVVDTDGTPQEGIAVYAFDGETYTGAHGTTDAAGEAILELPDGQLPLPGRCGRDTILER